MNRLSRPSARNGNCLLHPSKPVLAKRRRASSLQALARDARYDCYEVNWRMRLGRTALRPVIPPMIRPKRCSCGCCGGPGMTGFAGMPYVREDRIIRPLLAATREEVLAYLNHEGLTYRRIQSNDEGDSTIAIGSGENSFLSSPSWPRRCSCAATAVRFASRDEQYLEEVVDQLYRSCVSDGF